MPTYYIQESLGGTNGFVGSASLGRLESTPDFGNHHVIQNPDITLSLGREIYSAPGVSAGDYFVVNSISHYLERIRGTGTTTGMRSKIFLGSANSNNRYAIQAWSSSTDIPTTFGLYSFDYLNTNGSERLLKNGSYRFGIWVNHLGTDTGFSVGGEDVGTTSTQMQRQSTVATIDDPYSIANSQTFTTAATGFVAWTGRAIYGALNYSLPPATTFPSATFNENSGVVTVTWDAPDNGGSAITGYVYRYRVSDSTTWTQATTTATNRTFTFDGSFGTSYEVEVAAKNTTTAFYSTSATGAYGYDFVTVIRNSFSIDERTLGPHTTGVNFTEKITLSTGEASPFVDVEWDTSTSGGIAYEGQPDGVTVSSLGSTVTVSGTPTKIGNYRLIITMSASGEQTVTGRFPLRINPRVNVFTGVAGSEWQPAKAIKVFNGTDWVDVKTFSIFNNQTWVDPR